MGEALSELADLAAAELIAILHELCRQRCESRSGNRASRVEPRRDSCREHATRMRRESAAIVLLMHESRVSVDNAALAELEAGNLLYGVDPRAAATTMLSTHID